MNNNKDEEIRQKVLESYRGKLYLCTACYHVMIMYERKRERKEQVKAWCIICHKSTQKKPLTPEDVFNLELEDNEKNK